MLREGDMLALVLRLKESQDMVVDGHFPDNNLEHWFRTSFTSSRSNFHAEDEDEEASVS